MTRRSETGSHQSNMGIHSFWSIPSENHNQWAQADPQNCRGVERALTNLRGGEFSKLIHKRKDTRNLEMFLQMKSWKCFCSFCKWRSFCELSMQHNAVAAQFHAQHRSAMERHLHPLMLQEGFLCLPQWWPRECLAKIAGLRRHHSNLHSTNSKKIQRRQTILLTKQNNYQYNTIQLFSLLWSVLILYYNRTIITMA